MVWSLTGYRRCAVYGGVCMVVFGLAVPREKAHAEWSAIAQQKTSYTTDVFQFSSARRLAFGEDPSQPTVVPTDQPQDVIWEPALEVIRSTANTLGRNELALKAHGYLYTDKAIFNHGDYRVQNRQWFGADTSVLIRYRYVPNLFLGPNFERRTGTRSIQEERITSHHWRAELERRLNEKLSAALVGRYGLRLYNDAFAERDTRFLTVGTRADYRAARWITVSIGYLYERGLADGRQETQFNDDVSYNLHLVSFGTEVMLSPRVGLKLLYLHLRKIFTSDLAGDTHLGRRDFTHQGSMELRYAITPDVAATFGLQRTQRTSTNALRDFNDTILSIGVQYHF